MKRLLTHWLAVLLAFLIGVSAHAVWMKRQAILDACAEFIMNWQD